MDVIINGNPIFLLIFIDLFTGIEYAHFVVQRVNYNLTETLFELNGLLGMFCNRVLSLHIASFDWFFLAICDLEYKLEQIEPYQELCETEITSRKCCKPWSLPNYIALISNKTSCFDIEVSWTKKLAFKISCSTVSKNIFNPGRSYGSKNEVLFFHVKIMLRWSKCFLLWVRLYWYESRGSE